MNLIRALYSIALDALFPLHPAERAVLLCGPEGAWEKLPRASTPRTARMCGVFAYKDERASRLVWAIKYKKSRECAAIAGYALHRVCRQFLAALPISTPLVIVPMPITNKRRRERGYNQCELIMEEIMKLDATTHAARSAHQIIFAPGILSREQHTSRQTLKDREARLATASTHLFVTNSDAVARLVHATGVSELSSMCVVVIDDVITTGATLTAALDVLQAAGFSNTCGLSVAH